MSDYLVPSRRARSTMDVKGSRFIATLAPVESVEEVKAFIQEIRAEFPDASHNVPASIVGHGTSVIEHCNDDGEPSGTAGRPMLAVLKGSGLGDVAVVVTRFFGGTKLGTGGLVRAYGDAVKLVLSEATTTYKTDVLVLDLALPYSVYEPLKVMAEQGAGLIVSEDFGADVKLQLRFRLADGERFRKQVTDRWNQSVVIDREQIERGMTL